MSGMDMPLFKASEDCKRYDELLHYTSFDVLKIILSNRTIKCNSLGLVNDRLEQSRNGIEDFAKGFYISSFCHYRYEIVPFWFLYGGNVNQEKVLFRFRNFAAWLEYAIESDWAWTSEKKVIYFDEHKLFQSHAGNLSFNPVSDPRIEMRQVIRTIRLFDVEYRLPGDEVFSKEYAEPGSISFDGGESYFPVAQKDVRTVGLHKTIHWEYEAETRLKCMMSTITAPYFDFLLLRLKDEVFRDLKIVANPWATDSFIERIQNEVDRSTLPPEIKDSIVICRSELDGQIISM